MIEWYTYPQKLYYTLYSIDHRLATVVNFKGSLKKILVTHDQ